MYSFRRYYLDKLLDKHSDLISGKVLDVGGKKKGKRGAFDINSLNVDVIYLNSDQDTNPDLLASAENIPSGDKEFDTVIMTELLEYVTNFEQVMKEVHRVTKNKTNIIISIPFLHPIHGDYWLDRIRLTEQGIKDLSIKFGFNIKIIEPMGSVGAVIYDILRICFGYAGKSKFKSLFLFILYLSRVLFMFLDKVSKDQKSFINTGYFVVLSK